jgi:hypothetical protein
MNVEPEWLVTSPWLASFLAHLRLHEGATLVHTALSATQL